MTMTLHDAMIKVLKESTKECMTSREIADKINSQKLYERQDKGIIPTSQIIARANQYPEYFNKTKINKQLFISLKSN